MLKRRRGEGREPDRKKSVGGRNRRDGDAATQAVFQKNERKREGLKEGT